MPGNDHTVAYLDIGLAFQLSDHHGQRHRVACLRLHFSLIAQLTIDRSLTVRWVIIGQASLSLRQTSQRKSSSLHSSNLHRCPQNHSCPTLPLTPRRCSHPFSSLTCAIGETLSNLSWCCDNFSHVNRQDGHFPFNTMKAMQRPYSRSPFPSQGWVGHCPVRLSGHTRRSFLPSCVRFPCWSGSRSFILTMTLIANEPSTRSLHELR